MNPSRIFLAFALTIGGAALAGAQSRWGSAQDPYYGSRPYGYPGAYARGGPAYQFGFEDGRRDGERDFYRRERFRPERHGNFKHADRGYRGHFGDKRFYRDQYRAGYLEGYRSGYRSGAYRRW